MASAKKSLSAYCALYPFTVTSTLTYIIFLTGAEGHFTHLHKFWISSALLTFDYLKNRKVYRKCVLDIKCGLHSSLQYLFKTFCYSNKHLVSYIRNTCMCSCSANYFCLYFNHNWTVSTNLYVTPLTSNLLKMWSQVTELLRAEIQKIGRAS